MPGIPSTLLQEIRQTLMLCDEFSSQRQLKAIFAEQRLKTFQSGLPEADSTGGRVDLTISYLSGKRLSSGENGLVVLLEVLIGRKDQADELHSKLERLKGKLTVVLSGKMEAQMNLDNRGDSLNILVTGGRDINNQACAIAAAIGSLAVESGHKLLTGGATGTDERAAKGAYDYLIEMGKDPKESILTYRPEQSPKPHFEYGQVIIAGKKHYQRRGNLVQDCDVIIIISGDEGTDHIFELARQQNKPILPIGQTEGKAKEKWDAIAINLDSFYAGRVSKLDFRQLYSGSNAPEIIAQWAIRLAERIARIETKGSRVNNTESQSVEEQLQEEVESLKRQLKQLKHSLLRVQERRASFVDPRNAPPDLEENESLLKNRIADVEHRLLDLIG
jgi:predicted Rossmann-fold nucleotide-binding protein